MKSLEYLITNPLNTMFKSIALTLFSFLIVTTVQSQHWDYEKYPDRNVTFTHLDADIRLSEDPMISGDIIYTARVLRESVNSVVLHAVGLNIISVEVNGSTRNHRFRNNELIVELENSYVRGDVIQIRIQYDTNPHFGIHKSANGTIWSSLLPNSMQHWMPLFESPDVTLTSDIVFTHPSDISVVANGRRGNIEILSVNEAVTSFSSTVALPITGISFVAGDFSNSMNTMDSGITGFGRRVDSQIHIYSEIEYTGLEELLEYAVQRYRSVQEFVTQQYPFRDLHIVILEEDYLEVKSYGAGIVYLYQSRGDLRHQLDRALSAQWAGVYIREYQWDNPDAILFLQAVIMNELFERDRDIISADIEPYHRLSDDALFKWTHFLRSVESENLRQDFSVIKRQLFNSGMMTLDWEKLSSLLYGETGQNHFNGIEFTDEQEVEPIISEYSVNIEWDEIENRLDIIFESDQNPITELVTVELVEVNLSGERVHELSFTGESDGVVVNVASSVEYVKFRQIDRDDLHLMVSKPFLFWIAQLRDDADPAMRIDAAKGLSQIQDNPDLQLALNDILRTESNPQVYSEILRSMSALTRGAAGTEERFIQYSSNNQHQYVQLAAVKALGNYRENERVIGRLNTIISQTNNENLREEAIKSLATITSAERFSTISRNLVTRERVLNQVPLILNELAQKGEVSMAVELADSFLSETFPYSVRYHALKLIQSYDQSASNWMSRLPGLLNDSHPGIRLAATESLHILSNQQRNNLLNSAIENEYDERVRSRLLN